jgi:hypothetical protein
MKKPTLQPCQQRAGRGNDRAMSAPDDRLEKLERLLTFYGARKFAVGDWRPEQGTAKLDELRREARRARDEVVRLFLDASEETAAPALISRTP